MKTEATIVELITRLPKGHINPLLCESHKLDIASWPIISDRSVRQAARPRSLVGICISRIILLNCMGHFAELH